MGCFCVWTENAFYKLDDLYGTWCNLPPARVTTTFPCFSPLQSRHLGTSHSSPSRSCFPESHCWSENSSLSKVILVLGKAGSHMSPNLGCRGAESPGWFDVSPKNSAWVSALPWWSCQSPVAHSQGFWITQIVSAEEYSSFMQNLIQIHCPTHSVILNAGATQCTRSLNRVYHPHWLVQWSHHCSHMCIPVLSPWLSGYIDVVQTLLVILTMTGPFLDRPCII